MLSIFYRNDSYLVKFHAKAVQNLISNNSPSLTTSISSAILALMFVLLLNIKWSEMPGFFTDLQQVYCINLILF